MNRRLRYTVRFMPPQDITEFIDFRRVEFGRGDLVGLSGSLFVDVMRPVVTVDVDDTTTPAQAATRLLKDETLVSAEWVEIDGQESLL